MAGAPRGAADDVEVVPVRVRTRLFGTLSESFSLPIVAGHCTKAGHACGGRARSPSRGCAPGELLSRRTALPPRAALLARDGSVLAEGPATAAGTR